MDQFHQELWSFRQEILPASLSQNTKIKVQDAGPFSADAHDIGHSYISASLLSHIGSQPEFADNQAEGDASEEKSKNDVKYENHLKSGN